MPLAVTCPSCRKPFRVGEEYAGRPVTCPACQSTAPAAGPVVPPFDAFVSYSSKDKAVADAVVATLEADGVRCWVAPRDIVPGSEWSDAIIQGINQSRLVVLVFSANSNASQQVLREVERAVNRGMPVVPFRIENLLPSRGMEYFISASHWLDAYHPPLDDHLRKLSATSQALLAGSAAPADERPADLRGRLRAAARALTARDNRVRVLAGLAAVVFLIGLLAFAAVFALRPPAAAVAPPELVQAKADAEQLGEKVRALDPGQGVGAKADEVENHLKAARTFFDERKFTEAGEHFRAVADLAPQVLEAGRKRDDLRPLRDAVDREFDAARANSARAPLAWAEAETKKQTAERAFAAGAFDEARAAWTATQARLADVKVSLEVIAEKKALAFWLGYAGRGIREARHHADVLGMKPDDVSHWVTILRDKCKPRLGLKPELIDQLLAEKDNSLLLSFLTDTLPKAIRETPELGLEVQRAYRFGNDLATLGWGLESAKRRTDIGLEAMARSLKEFPPLPRVATWFQPVMEIGAAAGAPQEMLADLKATQAAFDKGFAASLGKLNPDFEFADTAVGRVAEIVEAYAATPEKGAESFALTLKRPGVPGQDEVLAELRRVRAAVYFDDPKTPTAVTEVFLFVPLADPARTLEAVGKLTTLRRLHLGFNPVGDDDVAKLAGLTELRELGLDQTRITDAALNSLKGMTKLERLYLNKTAVTDAGLARLEGLKELREVNVPESKVTQAGARALQRAVPRVRVVPFATSLEEERIKELFKEGSK